MKKRNKWAQFCDWCNSVPMWKSTLIWIALLIALASSAAGILLVIIFIFWSLIDFIFTHIVEIFVPITCLGGLIWWVKDRRAKARANLEQNTALQRQALLAQFEATKEATYEAGLSAIFSACQGLGANLGLVAPLRPSDLISPGRTFAREDGAVTVCQYLIQKSRDGLDLNVIREVLQTKVNQFLESGGNIETGISIRYGYQGRTYPGFLILRLTEAAGFVEIYTAQASDAACRMYERANERMTTITRDNDRRDLDF